MNELAFLAGLASGRPMRPDRELSAIAQIHDPRPPQFTSASPRGAARVWTVNNRSLAVGLEVAVAARQAVLATAAVAVAAGAGAAAVVVGPTQPAAHRATHKRVSGAAV